MAQSREAAASDATRLKDRTMLNSAPHERRSSLFVLSSGRVNQIECDPPTRAGGGSIKIEGPWRCPMIGRRLAGLDRPLPT